MDQQHKNSREWREITAKAGYWFSPSSMRYFGCRVYWNTLTELQEGYLFISSEANFDGSEKRYSIRKVNADYGIETIGSFGEFENLSSAKKALIEYVTEENNSPKPKEYYFLVGDVFTVTAKTLEEAEKLIKDHKGKFYETRTILQGVYNC